MIHSFILFLFTIQFYFLFLFCVTDDNETQYVHTSLHDYLPWIDLPVHLPTFTSPTVCRYIYLSLPHSLSLFLSLFFFLSLSVSLSLCLSLSLSLSTSFSLSLSLSHSLSFSLSLSLSLSLSVYPSVYLSISLSSFQFLSPSFLPLLNHLHYVLLPLRCSPLLFSSLLQSSFWGPKQFVGSTEATIRGQHGTQRSNRQEETSISYWANAFQIWRDVWIGCNKYSHYCDYCEYHYYLCYYYHYHFCHHHHHHYNRLCYFCCR